MKKRTKTRGFIPLKDIKDIRYGKVKLLKDPKNNTHYTSKNRLFHQRSDAVNILQGIQKRIDHPNLYYVAPVDSAVYDTPNFCSNAYKLQVVTPFPGEDLAQEINRRREHQKPYSNLEITNLLYNTIYGNAHIQKLGFTHGDFAPKWVARSTTGYAVMENPLRNPFCPIDLRN
jgi:hypothetical protein